LLPEYGSLTPGPGSQSSPEPGPGSEPEPGPRSESSLEPESEAGPGLEPGPGFSSMLTPECITSSSFRRVLLIDLHGMGPYTDFIVVGTLNGQTCTTNSDFLSHLRNLLGNTVLPLSGETDLPQYSGGYTVARHGGGSVDAFQLEFGGFLRTIEMRRTIAKVIGEAILRYFYVYIHKCECMYVYR
jgi:hypothetical protein